MRKRVPVAPRRPHPVRFLALGILAAVMAQTAARSGDQKGSAASARQPTLDTGGLIVQLGIDDPASVCRLRTGPSVVVQGLDTDDAKVQQARACARSQDASGPVQFDLWDGKHLPYADNLVNLLIVRDAAGASREELMRVVAPSGTLWMWKTAVGRKRSSHGPSHSISGLITCTGRTAIRSLGTRPSDRRAASNGWVLPNGRGTTTTWPV